LDKDNKTDGDLEKCDSFILNRSRDENSLREVATRKSTKIFLCDHLNGMCAAAKGCSLLLFVLHRHGRRRRK